MDTSILQSMEVLKLTPVEGSCMQAKIQCEAALNNSWEHKVTRFFFTIYFSVSMAVGTILRFKTK